MNLKSKIYRLIILVLAVLLVLAIYFFVKTNGKGFYMWSKALSQSKTIEESKSREVFIFELDYEIHPDTIKINDGVHFFLEKGFRYGENSINVTDSLLPSDNFKYQTVTEFQKEKKVFKEAYRSVGGGSRFIEVPDTIKREIYTLSPPL